MSCSVGPKVACVRKRDASLAVGAAGGMTGASAGLVKLIAPLAGAKNPLISPAGEFDERTLMYV